MTDTFTDTVSEIFREGFASIGRLFTGHHKQMVNILRQPSPLKFSRVLQADGNGVIGGGLTTPNSQGVVIYQAPVSHEAWINRISVTSPSGTPKSPLTTGQAYCVGSNSGELIFMLPIAGSIAPVQITEGRISAPHLSAGEQMMFMADTLPANCALRFDLQVVLVTGFSPDTPRIEDFSIPSANANLVD